METPPNVYDCVAVWSCLSESWPYKHTYTQKRTYNCMQDGVRVWESRHRSTRGCLAASFISRLVPTTTATTTTTSNADIAASVRGNRERDMMLLPWLACCLAARAFLPDRTPLSLSFSITHARDSHFPPSFLPLALSLILRMLSTSPLRRASSPCANVLFSTVRTTFANRPWLAILYRIQQKPPKNRHNR